MKRRLLNLLTSLSLLLCAAVVALWVRSYWRHDAAGARLRSVLLTVESHRGRLGWVATDVGDAYEDQPERKTLALYHDSEPADCQMDPFWQSLTGKAAWKVLGLSYTAEVPSLSPLRALVTPSWFVTLLLAVPPAARMVVSRRRSRRVRAGLCPKCGYDLRATPGRCPECGTLAKAPA